MILGTSKISLNLGPIIGHFWAREPRIYGFSYTKNTSKNIRKYMGTSLKHIMFTYLDFRKFVKFGNDGHQKMMKIRLKKSSKP